MTGSTPDGKAFPPDKDMTCKNYTAATQGAVMLGHNDRQGLDEMTRLAFVELLASLARSRRRLLAGRSAVDRRRRAAVLLRGQLN